jgi:glycosyltransferase involved in cell wall biosynthesis
VRPVVASAFDDAGQLIVDGESGYLFRPGSTEDLRRALRRAYSERAQWAAMGARARKAVMERHNGAAGVQQMIAEIEPILGAKYGMAYPTGRS